MFQNIKLYFYKKYLQSQLNQHLAIHEMVSFKSSQKIGILFDSTNEDNIPVVNEYVKKLEKAKKQVKILGYIDSNRAATENMNYDTFSRKGVNWYYRPIDSTSKDFAEKKFDILINAFITPSPPLEYITTFSQAKLRVGPYDADKTHCFDFMINIETDSLEEYIHKVHHYLEIINNTNESSI